MEASHPRQETNKERARSRRLLRESVEDRLKEYGVETKDQHGWGVHILHSNLRFSDGQDGTIARFRKGEGVNRIDYVIINIYHTEDRTGPSTQYTSRGVGEFTRSDKNPQVMGTLSEAQLRSLGEEERPAALFAGAIATALSQAKNQHEGVDDFPITAQEADDVRERLEAAVFLG